MKSVLKFKWPIAIGLIVLTVVLFLLAPNLTEQAEQAGSFQLSDEASSQIASRTLTDADAADQTISLVMHLERELTDSTRETVDEMGAVKEAMGDPVTSV